MPVSCMYVVHSTVVSFSLMSFDSCLAPLLMLMALSEEQPHIHKTCTFLSLFCVCVCVCALVCARVCAHVFFIQSNEAYTRSFKGRPTCQRPSRVMKSISWNRLFKARFMLKGKKKKGQSNRLAKTKS